MFIYILYVSYLCLKVISTVGGYLVKTAVWSRFLLKISSVNTFVLLISP